MVNSEEGFMRVRLDRGFLAASILAFVLSAPFARADATLDRGAYLMKSIVACGNCHTPKGPDGHAIAGRELAGGLEFNAPIFHAIAPNITPDPDTGIGKWTDAQIIDAIRNGKRPDGTIIGPPMPIAFYCDMSDADVKAIVAYLRQASSISNKVEKSKYNIPLPASYGPPVTSVPHPDSADKVTYGRYLATGLGHCMDCHTPMVQGRNDMTRMGAGGNKIGLPVGGGVIVTANLTPANPDGVAHWTDAQVKTSIQTGARPDGRNLAPLMAFDWYKNISDDDMSALIAFLRTLKPAN